jgi:4-amino-4-deoxy-L-arabinose transferase-like glycosyltransferase
MRPRTIVAVVIAASVLIRVAVFRQIDRTPLVRMDRWSQTDMHAFDAWARQIAAGDSLSSTVAVPMHRWHREIADRYLAAHSAEAGALAGTDAGAAMWARWMHTPRFYQDPLYPYLLAAVYRVTAADPRYAIAGQLIVGVLTNLLIWALARRYFGDAVGVCAAAMAVLCAPLVFYESLLLRDSAVVFAGLALVWLADRAMATDRSTRWLAFGVSLGIAVLLKSTFALFAIAFASLFVATHARGGRPWGAAMGMTGLGFALALTPVIARNAAVGVPPLSMAASGPLTFVAANEHNAMPDVGFAIDAPVLTAFLGDTDGGWRSALRAAMAGHTAASAAALLWRKWDRAWHWFEIPNNENFYYLRRQAPMLAWLPLTFWLLAPLALVGLPIGARRLRDVWPLYVLIGTILASLVGFYVLGRFRASLIGATIPLAALTVVEIARWVVRGPRLRALAAAASIGTLAMWTGRPLADDQLLIRTADWILPYSVFYQDRVYGALDRKAWNDAAQWYLAFFEYEPRPAEILASADPRLAPELADMHQECAQILRLAGRGADANRQLARAQEILALRPLR